MVAPRGRVRLFPGKFDVEACAVQSFLYNVAVPLVLIATGCTGPRPSQRELPPSAVVLGDKGKVAETSAVSLGALGGFLGAGYFLRRDESNDTITTEHRLEERIGVGGVGSVLSPQFLTYDGVGILGFAQDYAEDNFSSSADSGELYEADAKVKLFPLRWHPFTVEFLRYDDFQPRVFFTRTESTTTAMSATQSLQYEKGSFNFGYVYRDNQLETFGADSSRLIADTTEDSVRADGHYRISANQNIDGRYVYRDVRQLSSQADFSEHRVDADHRVRFGDSGEHELRSLFRGEDRIGQFDQRSVSLEERLRYLLSEDLTARSGVSGETGTRSGRERVILRGDASLTHQLFDSLVSTVGARGSLSSEGDSSTDLIGGLASLDYTKNTPVGRLRMGYSVDLERRFIERGSGLKIDERQTFPIAPPEEVRLDQVGADIFTIVVTDLSGSIFYEESIDYSVDQGSGGVTLLTRIFTGAIPAGASILIDYDFEIGADYTQDGLGQRAILEHVFRGGITPFVRYKRRDQTIFDVRGFGVPNEIDEESVRTGLEWRYSPYSLGAEYEHQTSTIAPFEAVRLRASGSHPLSVRHRIFATLSQSWIAFDESINNPSADRQQSIFRSIAGLESKLGPRSNFRLDAAFRWQDDSDVGITTGISARGELRYMWRRFSIRLRTAYRDVQTTTSDYRGVELGIWIVRDFGSSTSKLRNATSRFSGR